MLALNEYSLAVSGQHEVASTKWPARSGQHEVASTKWPARSGQHEVASTKWPARSGQHEVASTSSLKSLHFSFLKFLNDVFCDKGTTYSWYREKRLVALKT